MKGKLIHSGEYEDVLIGSIISTKQTIKLAYYLANTSFIVQERKSLYNIVNHLQQAVSQGISIQLLLGWPDTKSSRSKNVISAGWLKKKGIDVKIARGISFHHKFSLFDDRYVICGSHNLTPGAISENIELSLYLESEKINNKLHQQFDEIWSKSDSIILKN